jgi:hypothetical protein
MTAATEFKLVETTEDRFWEQLCCLPPRIQANGGFLVGEPMSHNDEGYPTYSAYWEIGGKFFAADRPITLAEFKAFTPA